MGAHEFEAVHERHMAFAGDDGAGGRVGLAEVRVAGGDHPADPLAVRGVVEEALDLRRHRFARIAAAIGGHDDDVRFAHVERCRIGLQRYAEHVDAARGEIAMFHEPFGVARRRREVDDGAHARTPLAEGTVCSLRATSRILSGR